MSFEAEQAAIARRQKIAEQMMAQGQEPLETNQMAGGYVVPVSPLSGIGKIAQQLAGAYIGKQADQQKAGLDDKKTEIIRQLYQGGETPTLDKIAETGLASPDVMFALGNEKAKADRELQGKREDRLLQAQLTAQQRKDDQEWKAQEAQLARDEAARNHEAMIRLAASLRPAPQPHQDTLVQVVGPDGNAIYVPSSQASGKPAFNSSASTTQAPKLNPTIEKEIFEADDLTSKTQNAISLLKQAQELNKLPTYSGYGAHTRAIARSNLPGESEEASNTINLDNIMQAQALEQLKATFGGNPTEGERAVLLDLQASSNKSPADRAKIIDRALTMADKRLKFHSQKAVGLRNGSYFADPPAVISDEPAQPAAPVIRYDAQGRRIP